MFAKAAEDVQGKLTGSLFELLFTPAAFFWLAGLVVWEIADPHRLKDLANTLTTLGDVKLLLYSGAALALVVFSGAAYEPVNGWFLQRLLGYWWPFDILGAPFRALLRSRVTKAVDRQQTNGEKPSDRVTLHYFPTPDAVMPTDFGCALVAADQRIFVKYGISADVVWTALSYVLPDAARKTVADGRSDIEASGRLIFWTLASLGWIALDPRWPVGAIVAGAVVAVAAFAYLRLVQQGRDYADEYEAAFDVGRASLYRALRIPLPPSNDLEPQYGKLLTDLVYRGYPASGVTYTE